MSSLQSRPAYYDSDEWVEFDDTIRTTAERHGLIVESQARADGVWLGESEPAGSYQVTGSETAIRSWAADVAGRYNQDAVMVLVADAKGKDTLLTYGTSANPIDVNDAAGFLHMVGVQGATAVDGTLQIVSIADSELTPSQHALLGLRYGIPTTQKVRADFVEKNPDYLKHSPIKDIQAIRTKYGQNHQLATRTPIPHLTQADDIAAARHYDVMQHDPERTDVKRSYRCLRQHIAGQYNALTAAGYTFIPWTGDTEQPYRNSAEMMADLRNNKRLYYFRTEVSDTTAGALPAAHPMAQKVTVTGPGGEPVKLIANDAFRAVHDAFAHSDGFQFGPEGEKRAWWTHRSSMPAKARIALWCETRGQNVWTNAGPHMQASSGTSLLTADDPGFQPVSQRPYAAQKAGFVPEAFR